VITSLKGKNLSDVINAGLGKIGSLSFGSNLLICLIFLGNATSAAPAKEEKKAEPKKEEKKPEPKKEEKPVEDDDNFEGMGMFGDD
jgi:ribosomal protein L12E/L44/L45/RPP1/RPP2